MADVFSAESRLIHAGTERAPGLPATPPLVPASIYVSPGTPRPGRGYGRDGNPGWDRLRPNRTRPVPVDLQDLAAVERELTAAPSLLAADLITDIDQALEVL
jgi:hypothetical protein